MVIVVLCLSCYHYATDFVVLCDVYVHQKKTGCKHAIKWRLYLTLYVIICVGMDKTAQYAIGCITRQPSTASGDCPGLQISTTNHYVVVAERKTRKIT